MSADVILFGPGSLFTSVRAAWIVPGVTRALAGTNAKEIYLANPHEQILETERYPLEDHVDALIRHGVVANVVLGSLFAVRGTAVFTARSQCGALREKWHGPRCAKIG